LKIAENSKLKEKISKLKERLKKKWQENKNLKFVYEKSMEEIKILSGDKLWDIQSLQEENQKLKAEIEKFNHELENNATNKILQEELNEVLSRLEKAKSRIIHLETEYFKLQAVKNVIDIKVNKSESDVDEIRNQNQKAYSQKEPEQKPEPKNTWQLNAKTWNVYNPDFISGIETELAIRVLKGYSELSKAIFKKQGEI
jgi:chromosome segregation ATPase